MLINSLKTLFVLLPLSRYVCVLMGIHLKYWRTEMFKYNFDRIANIMFVFFASFRVFVLGFFCLVVYTFKMNIQL